MKKISKIMWGLVLSFLLFAMIVGIATGDTLLAEFAGRLVVFALLAQIILYIIGLFGKNTKANSE